MSKIRISFVADSLDFGGTANVVRELVHGLDRDRFALQQLFLKEAGSVGTTLIEQSDDGADVLRKGRYDAATPFRIAGKLRSFSTDILYTVDHHNAIFWGTFASVMARTPKRVVASHTTGRIDGSPSFSRTDRWMLPRYDSIVALSASHAGYLSDTEGIPVNKIDIIENGIDPDRYENVPPGAVQKCREELGLTDEHFVVLMTAAMRPEKAHSVTLRVARRLIRTHRNLRVLLVGDGPLLEQVEKWISRFALDRYIFALGRRTDVPALLKTANVMVLPSYPAVETLPLAVIEAMASGVPVIASAVGSVPDMIEDEYSGWLIGPADLDGLELRLRNLIESGTDTRDIVANARKTVHERYTTVRMVQLYARLFERLMERE